MDAKKKMLLKSFVCIVVSFAIARLMGQVIGTYGTNMYVDGFLSELVLAICGVISLTILKKLDVLKIKTEGLIEGFLTGAVLIVLGLIVIWVAFGTGMDVTASTIEILFFVLHMLMVGVAEEVLFRGISQNAIMDCLGQDSIAKVRIGIVISGIIFASIHLLNAFLPGVGIMSALRQTISIIPVGILLGTVYYRGKNNIWVVILLHAFNDFYTFLMAGYISNATINDGIATSSNSIAGTLVLFTIIDLWILRKKKLIKCISAE